MNVNDLPPFLQLKQTLLDLAGEDYHSHTDEDSICDDIRTGLQDALVKRYPILKELDEDVLHTFIDEGVEISINIALNWDVLEESYKGIKKED